MDRLAFHRILLTGASGFIGHHVFRALLDAGCEVVPVSRRHGVNIARRCCPEDWMTLLDGVDAVVNAVGIIGETAEQTFQTLHATAPTALFQACQAQGVRRVVQVSALGADDTAFSPYHRSKWAADEALRALALQSVVLRPALVYGPGGISARKLLKWSRLPWLVVPGDGAQTLQPLDVADVVAAILRCLGGTLPQQRTVDLVGPQTFTLTGWLQRLRAAQGLGPAPLLRMPLWLARALVAVGRPLDPMIRPDNLRMLLAGYCGKPCDAVALLGRAPIAPTDERLRAAVAPQRWAA